MARVAGFTAVVPGQYHLRELFGFGRVRIMAPVAQLGHIRTRRLLIAHRLGMPERRPVAGFARYPGMLALAFERRHGIVAGRALCMPRVAQRAVAVVVQRAGAFLSVGEMVKPTREAPAAK